VYSQVIIVVADTTGEADEADAKALRVVLSLMGMRSQVSVISITSAIERITLGYSHRSIPVTA
jgi:hypothetical protein